MKRAVLSNVEVGCNPVRWALSQGGSRAYVTTSKDNASVIFDTLFLTLSKTQTVARVPVGTAPVPVAVVDENLLLVGNSNRFVEGSKSEAITVVDPSAAKVTGTFTVGPFPRNIVVSSDGRTVYIANFGSNSISVLDAGAIR